MAAFDRLQLAAFAGFKFPVKVVSVKGSLRHHVHEYPHAPGGSTEDLGRKLYQIKMIALMHEGFAKWPRLWPETLGTLRTLFEGGQPWDLVVPTIGTISARCIEWEQEMNAKARSGEDCQFLFLEEQTDAFLADELVTTSTNDLVSLVTRVNSLAAARDTSRLGETDLVVRARILEAEDAKFEKLSSLTSEITSLDRSAEQYGSLVTTKTRAAASMLRDLDNNARTLKDPANWELVLAVQELETELRRLARDGAGQRKETRVFVVRKVSTIAQVSTDIYGRTDRAKELLRLNDFDNVLSIPVNTQVLYYPIAS